MPRSRAQRLLRAHIEQSKIEVRKIALDMLYQARNRSLARKADWLTNCPAA